MLAGRVRAGAGLAMLLGPTVVEAVCPAESVIVLLTVWLAPSFCSMASAGHPPIMGRLPSQVKCTVTSLLFQPLAFEAGLALPVMLGGTVWMLMPPTVTLALL